METTEKKDLVDQNLSSFQKHLVQHSAQKLSSCQQIVAQHSAEDLSRGQKHHVQHLKRRQQQYFVDKTELERKRYILKLNPIPGI